MQDIIDEFQCCKHSRIREIKKNGVWFVYCESCKSKSTPDKYRANAQMNWLKISNNEIK